MIAFIGDVHERRHDFFETLRSLDRVVSAVVQVGDFPLYPYLDRVAGPWLPPQVPIYFIDGNHHYFPETRPLKDPHIIRPGLTFVPRGTVLEIDGRRIGFLGGADSIIDRRERRPFIDWWPEESVQPVDVARLVANVSSAAGLNFLVSHTPPLSVIPDYVPDATRSRSAALLEEAWMAVGRPSVICGHLHHSLVVGNVQVLNELEVAYR